jgi:hypothetical protein
MIWPALFNRYPLLYPDSMTYLENGRLVGRALFLHQLSDYYGMRSFIYGLGIFLFHWDASLWPIVLLNALLTSWLVWLAVRSILPRHTASYFLALCFLLSMLTSLGWFVSLTMPDILAPLLYLGIYLLVFARESLSRVERWALILIAWWAVASHATHLMIASGMCILLAAMMVCRCRLIRHRWKAVGELAMIVLLAAVAQVALNAYLYGVPTLNGERMPFLMARVIVDGPGRWYLEQHCAEVKFAVCEDVHNLPTSTDDFLWGADGIWQRASDEKQIQIRKEEIPFVLATLRAYPRQQLVKSAGNFWSQLTTIGVEDLGATEDVLQEFDHVMPGERAQYQRSRQAGNNLFLGFFTSIQNWIAVASAVVIGILTPYVWRRKSARLSGFALVIVCTLIGNAFVTGALSAVEPRYQSRAVWLLVLLAAVFVLSWRNGHQHAMEQNFAE